MAIVKRVYYVHLIVKKNRFNYKYCMLRNLNLQIFKNLYSTFCWVRERERVHSRKPQALGLVGFSGTQYFYSRHLYHLPAHSLCGCEKESRRFLGARVEQRPIAPAGQYPRAHYSQKTIYYLIAKQRIKILLANFFFLDEKLRIYTVTKRQKKKVATRTCARESQSRTFSVSLGEFERDASKQKV